MSIILFGACRSIPTNTVYCVQLLNAWYCICIAYFGLLHCWLLSVYFYYMYSFFVLYLLVVCVIVFARCCIVFVLHILYFIELLVTYIAVVFAGCLLYLLIACTLFAFCLLGCCHRFANCCRWSRRTSICRTSSVHTWTL